MIETGNSESSYFPRFPHVDHFLIFLSSLTISIDTTTHEYDLDSIVWLANSGP